MNKDCPFRIHTKGGLSEFQTRLSFARCGAEENAVRCELENSLPWHAYQIQSLSQPRVLQTHAPIRENSHSDAAREQLGLKDVIVIAVADVIFAEEALLQLIAFLARRSHSEGKILFRIPQADHGVDAPLRVFVLAPAFGKHLQRFFQKISRQVRGRV